MPILVLRPLCSKLHSELFPCRSLAVWQPKGRVPPPQPPLAPYYVYLAALCGSSPLALPSLALLPEAWLLRVLQLGGGVQKGLHPLSAQRGVLQLRKRTEARKLCARP